MPKVSCASILALSFLLCASASFGQVATGTYPYGTFDTLGLDTIDVGNLNVHLNIPVLNKPGRGLPFSYAISYDSSVWMPVTSGGVQQWQPVLNWGWRGSTEITTGYISESLQNVACAWEQEEGREIPIGYKTTISNVVYHDTWGASHPFTGTGAQSP